ncbi:RusA family crossover junction endodeoxyribonuclease [Terasakiella sp.]|uniref:RusA family crossover junction endodeoxyribonuclease n=1 Tax=Terasakiella sp. TaxID=2034861 RepID=UPI003AA7EE9E
MTDDTALIERLKKSRYEQPPLDELYFEVRGLDLPSVQSKKDARALFDQAITELLNPYQYLLISDVAVVVEWLGDWEHRYDTSRSTDVDNVIKPLLDSLCGPDRLLIDDNQIYSFHVNWIDHHEPGFNLFLKYGADDYSIDKNGIAFLEMHNHLYRPVDLSWPIKSKEGLLKISRSSSDFEKKATDAGVDPFQARIFRPIHRLFHRGRIGNKYRIVSDKEFIATDTD